MKNIVKLNEAQLKKIVAESVKKVLKEDFSSSETAHFGDETYRAKKEGFSYIGSAISNIELVQNLLSNLTDHINSLTDSDEDYAFSYMNESDKTIEIMRKIWPLAQEICKIWGYQQ